MKKKACFKCEELKSIDQFYRHPRMADGRLNKCKDCTKNDIRCNYRERLEQYAAYDRKRFGDPKRKAWRRAHQRKRRAENPIPFRARKIVGRAIKSGRLKRRPCENCGQRKVEAHHDDHEKPLKVRWLCFSCHRIEHGQKPRRRAS